MVYHYTTIETLYNILASYKEAEDKEHFTFWASNALEQNDSEELKFDYKDLREAILKVEKEKEENGISLSHKRLSNAVKWGWLNGMSTQEAVYEINRLLKDQSQAPYTLSFSYQEDKLLMWSIYANRGNGICLAFNEKELNSLQTGMMCVSDSVKYDKNTDNLTNIVGLLYDAYLKSFEKDKKVLLNKVNEEGTTYQRMMLGLISPFIKNKAFEDEKEWRLIFYKNKEAKIFTRLTGNQNVIHYVKVGLPISALKKIIVGPCANYDKTIELLIKEASNCGLDKMTKQEFYIKSKVPYRHF